MLHSHDNMVFSFFALGMALAGPFLTWTGFRAWRIRRLIEGTPASRIRSMAMGLVELNGSVSERSRVSAPFSGRPCAYWEIEIQTRNSRKDRPDGWTTVHRNRSGHPFYLRDETGVALVYPQGAECHLPFGVEEQTGGFGVPEPYAGYMEQQGLAMRGVWAIGPMRFRERMLEDDAHVFVLGRAFPRAQSHTISWDENEEQATGTDGHAATRLQSLDSEVRGVIRRGSQDPVFVISQTSEKTMEFMYGLKAFGGIAGGPLLTLFGVWCLIELAKAGQLFH
jgi:hypothetical protein